MRKLGSSIGSIFLSNAILGIFGIVFVPIALRNLGSEKFGIYAAYSTMLSIITLIDLGVIKNLTRKIAATNDNEVISSEIRNVNTMYTCIGLVLLVFMFPLSRINATYIFPTLNFDAAIISLTYICCLEYIISIPCNIVIAYAISKEKFLDYSRYNLTSGVIRYSIMITVLLLTHDPVVLALAIALRKPIETILALMMLGALPQGSWVLNKDFRSALLTFSETFSLSSAQILQTLVIAVGSVFVNRFSGLTALGNYRAAFDLASRIWFVSNGIGAVIFPRLVKMNGNIEKANFLSNILPAILYTSWLFYIFLSLVVAFSAATILSLLHIQNTGVQPLLVLMTLGISMNAHANLSYEYLQSKAEYIKTAWLSFLSLTLMIFVYLVGYSYLGVFTIGYSWIASQSIYAIAADFQIIKHSGKNLLVQIVIFLIAFFIIVQQTVKTSVISIVIAGVLLVIVLIFTFPSKLLVLKGALRGS